MEQNVTWIGSNMPQGMLIGVPGGGKRSGKGSRGKGVIIIGASVFCWVELTVPSVTVGSNVVFRL